MRGTSTALSVVVVVLFFFGSGQGIASAEKDRPAEPPVAKVKIQKGGGISLDGQSVSLEELRARLKKHKEAGGVVWYYRESADKKAEAQGESVIKVIIELELPVKLMEGDAG